MNLEIRRSKKKGVISLNKESTRLFHSRSLSLKGRRAAVQNAEYHPGMVAKK